MKGVHIHYSAAELEWLEENRTMPIQEYWAAWCDKFGRTDVSAGNLHALRKRKGWRTGRTGHFTKGQEAHNKGRKCGAGKGGRHPNAIATQFKPGVRQGIAVALYKPVGTERVTDDGYIERKVNDGLPLNTRWRAVHLINWEAVNGPLPAGHCLKCLDGNKGNTDPANWECISRALLPRLNGGRMKTKLAYDDASPEVRPAILAIAKLDNQARQARKGKGS